MGRRVLNRFLERFGYRISKLAPEPDTSRGYALYTYLTKDGVFDYGQYRHIQREGNKRKLNLVWVCEENIDFLSRYIQERIGTPRFDICHGTRRGMEQAWFAERLRCEVLGPRYQTLQPSSPIQSSGTSMKSNRNGSRQ